MGLVSEAEGFQERGDGLGAAEEFLDRDVYVGGIAGLVNFFAQVLAGLHVEVAPGHFPVAA